jgi:hypothetical protein
VLATKTSQWSAPSWIILSLSKSKVGLQSEA